MNPNNLLFAASHPQRIGDVAQGMAREIDDVADRSCAAIYRDHPLLELAKQA